MLLKKQFHIDLTDDEMRILHVYIKIPSAVAFTEKNELHQSFLQHIEYREAKYCLFVGILIKRCGCNHLTIPVHSLSATSIVNISVMDRKLPVAQPLLESHPKHMLSYIDSYFDTCRSCRL